MLRFVFLAAAALAAGEVHDVKPETFYHTFFHRHPVLKQIKPGDTVITYTIDAGGQDSKDVRRATPSNPLTGPFFIEGAEPGDAITVRFQRIRMNRKWGWSNYRLGLFSLTPESIETTYPRRYKDDLIRAGRNDLIPWDIDLENQTVQLREPQSKHLALKFPARPMLGCVGVAAPGEFAPTSGISGTYGGNMDYNEIVEGVTLTLPVYHPGALLYIGDGHALQADGEPVGTGVETSMDVMFTVGLRKNANLPGPRLENDDYIIAIASQPEFVSSLDRTIRLATSDMIHWLTTEFQIEPWAAHQLIAFQGRYDVITVAGSMALKIPKKALARR
ncbi:MAG: acetamidase [Acidimicrobiia bacterium]|nr:acetamidase [Acidimicrobiia bacterium]